MRSEGGVQVNLIFDFYRVLMCAWVSVWDCGWGLKAFSALIFIMISVFLIFFDLKWMILPDLLTLGLLWLGLLFNLKNLWVALPSAVLGAVFGYLILWGMYWIFKFFTGREGLGFGDFKLMAALGAWCGMSALPLILMLSSVFGLFFMAILRVWRKIKLQEKPTEVPFGPALLFAGGICLFLT